MTESRRRYQAGLLDLYDISLLLNYERAVTEPRFRHAKLREVATTNDFQTVRLLAPEWNECTIPRTGLLFDKSLVPASELQTNEPDLPSNMLPPSTKRHTSVKDLTSKELETYYWQARNHDGCFTTVALFQYFIDLFPEFTRVRVRTVDKDGKVTTYSTLASDRFIVEMHLFGSKSLTMATVLPDGLTHISGGDNVIQHAVLGFSSPGTKIDTILDLTSLQFGDVGRGFKGRGLFVLEPIQQYVGRLDKFAEQNDFKTPKMSARISDTVPNSEWLKKVAKKVKERWDQRETVHWCGHCGSPPRDGNELQRCGTCKAAYYCNVEHQKAAWAYHKHFCAAPKT